jgi:hypothetical protein
MENRAREQCKRKRKSPLISARMIHRSLRLRVISFTSLGYAVRTAADAR